ncbi:protein disulfide-isomerase TMX3 [Dendroctonus ponderosae]|uniref:Thioredoxin domain-containing protein n=1 Tax=Dendroctonus ponderosae TaxID=77166 RepID=U4TYU6_DENPD|nr:protein disulfide-isomerase TMX3 [Dendroctonus ponderosae]ERL86794.1 hypothetical protein D910_04199 [Dendroctonus ponderosae]KAH1003332.1 hypothetical protein HUJ05_011256 [Dendroctonus ponderosae]
MRLNCTLVQVPLSPWLCQFWINIRIPLRKPHSKMNVLWLTPLIVLLGSFRPSNSSRVLELSNGFQKVRKSGGRWLVKFYAPWCGHCKRLEPIWIKVAQALSSTNVRVGRVDVTSYPSVGTEFNAFATPTIKFITPDSEHTYTGDRTLEALVNYGKRMAAPPVQEVRKVDSVAALKKANQLFFMYVGEREGPLWDTFYAIACHLQPHAFFYSTSYELGREALANGSRPFVLVHKDQELAFFPNSTQHEAEPSLERLNASLAQWVNRERFGTFPKLTSDAVKEVMQTGKFLVLAIVEEFRQGPHISEPMLEFRHRVESVIRRKRSLYHEHFQFGWMGSPDLANSLLMTRVPLPFLLVLNSSTLHHHQPDEEPARMSAEQIEAFLDRVLNETSPRLGGNGLYLHMARKVFDVKRHLEDMWLGNRFLIMLLFGLPGLFLMLILWASCCTDMLDAAEDDEDENGLHEKKE